MQLTLLMVLAMALWGAGWPALKIVTETLDVEVVTFWRFLLMFLAFIPVLLWWKKPIALTGKTFFFFSSSALLNIAFMYTSFWGVAAGTAGGGGVIITTISPVLTVLLAMVVFKTAISPRRWFGLLVGLVGGAVMLELWAFDFSHSGMLFFLLSALIWAVLTLFSQRSHAHMEPVHYSFMLAAVAMAVTFFIALPHGVGAVFEQDGRFWAALLFLAIMGQTVATTIFFIASGKLGSGAASSYMFMVPLSALVSSFIVLDEHPSLTLLIGGMLGMAAVYLINKK